MRISTLRFLWIAIPFIPTVSLVIPTVSLADSPSLEGAWSGSGYVKPNDGARESVRCRVKYTKSTDKVFQVSANCATPSAKVSQTGNVLKVGANSYVGEFHNPEFDVSGRIRITVSGSRQTIILSSKKGSGRVTLSRR